MATERQVSRAGSEIAPTDPALAEPTVTDPTVTDPAARAALLALEHEGLGDDGQHDAYDGAWRSAGLREAVERTAPASGYAPPARSTRGATRA